MQRQPRKDNQPKRYYNKPKAQERDGWFTLTAEELNEFMGALRFEPGRVQIKPATIKVVG
jgi:hypothetical protein